MNGDLLIVDDLSSNLELLSSILTREGYRVRAANSGALALRITRRQPPELILLDVNMPGLDGYEVCCELQSNAATARIPVIFVSALDDVVDKVRGFDVGAVDFVVKPYEPEEILARVRTQLEVDRLRRQLERTNAVLERKNLELLRTQRRVEMVFSTLSDVLPGTILDKKYQLDAQIGSGGFGAVYRATHLDLDRPVAIKIFQPVARGIGPESFDRFRREGMTACRIQHPNAVQVLDSSVTEQGIAYLVMELLDGFSLRHLLDHHGRLPLPQTARIAEPVAGVLAAAAAAHLVHRDVKPENIFLHRDGPRQIVKVVDFGIAKMLEDDAYSSARETTGLIGTPQYIAPERMLEDAYDHRSDTYSLGVVIYEMLTGHLPFEALEGSYTILSKICREPARDIRELQPDLDPEIVEMVMTTLSKVPERRPAAAEIADLLRRKQTAGSASFDVQDSVPDHSAPADWASRRPRRGPSTSLTQPDLTG